MDMNLSKLHKIVKDYYYYSQRDHKESDMT